MKNRCFECEDRRVGCHANCERYAEWREWLRERKAKERAAREIKHYEMERSARFFRFRNHKIKTGRKV